MMTSEPVSVDRVAIKFLYHSGRQAFTTVLYKGLDTCVSSPRYIIEVLTRAYLHCTLHCRQLCSSFITHREKALQSRFLLNTECYGNMLIFEKFSTNQELNLAQKYYLMYSITSKKNHPFK